MASPALDPDRQAVRREHPIPDVHAVELVSGLGTLPCLTPQPPRP